MSFKQHPDELQHIADWKAHQATLTPEQIRAENKEAHNFCLMMETAAQRRALHVRNS